MSEQSLEGMSQADLANMAALQAKLLSDPRTRKEMLKAIKTLHPDFTAPELAAEEATGSMRKEFEGLLTSKDERIGALEKKFEEQSNARAEERAREAWNKLKMAPVEQGLCREEELPDLEKFMKEEGFNNTQYLQAAKFRAAQNAMAPPTPAPLTRFKMPEKGDLRKDPKEYFRKNTLDAINEARAKRATGGIGGAR